MNNPLTEEQIKRINEISRLPPETQNEELQEFLKTLSPEQIEFLKSQQQQGCLFCKIAEGAIQSRKIYEDANFIAILDINPANKGHVLLFPKEHYESLLELPDNLNLLDIAKKLSIIITKSVNAEGINLFIANGTIAGQKVPHLVIHLIPRFKDDKINFAWNPKKITDEELAQLEVLLREEASNIFFKREEKEVVEKIEPEEDFEEERIP